MKEVVALQQLVAEFGVADAFGSGFLVAADAALHRVFGHHIIHGEVLAYVAQKVEKAEALKPVVIVDEHRAGGRVVEFQESFELGADAGLVGAQGGFVEQVALGRFAGGRRAANARAA